MEYKVCHHSKYGVEKEIDCFSYLTIYCRTVETEPAVSQMCCHILGLARSASSSSLGDGRYNELIM